MKGKKLSTLNDNKREIGETKKKKARIISKLYQPIYLYIEIIAYRSEQMTRNARGTAYRNTSSFLLIERY